MTYDQAAVLLGWYPCRYPSKGGPAVLLIVLSWVIGVANCTSGILVGPLLATVLRRFGAPPKVIMLAQGLGWLVLFAGQGTFWLFGFRSGFPGFMYAQPIMIPIAGGNFAVWLIGLRQTASVAKTAVVTVPGPYEITLKKGAAPA